VDPTDTWAVSIPGGPRLVELRVIPMRNTGNITARTVSGGIAFARDPLL
jgi:hypothetical protein